MQKQNLWSTILQKLGLEVNQMNAHVLMNNYSNFLLPLETMVSPFARKGSNQSQSPDISSNMSTRTPQLPPNPLANHQAQIASMKNNISPQMGVGDMSMSSNTIQHQLNNSAAQIVQQNQMNLIIQQQQQQKLLQNQIQQDSHLQQQIQAPNESSRAIAATATSPAMQPPSPNVMIKSETSNVPSEAPSYPDQKNDSVVKTELTEEESKYYFTKTRKLNTFGGIDLVSLGPALQRMKASKEQYGNSCLT
jgi:glucan-binding YG repeat protein